jgi:fructokinase
VKLSQKGKDIIQMPAIKIDKVMDSTGAGDALVWILFAFIKEKSINECLDIALKLAALKLQNVGRLPDNINILSKLYKSVWKEIIKNISNGVMLNAYPDSSMGKI